jgi:hypothetical protein
MSEPSALSNLHYYQILGLRRTDVTQDEVKRAYKRLSLKFHPDRNRDDPNTTAKFQEISTAYNVLSSPRKRQIYDAYGEQGLKMYDSYMSFADSDDDSSKMPLQPVTMLLMVCVGISVLIFMSAAFGMLLLLYLSGSISPPLAVVFLPLWLVAAGGLCCLSVSLVGSRTNQTNLAVATLQLLCAVAFLILLCVRADSDQHLAYTCVVACTSPPALPSGPPEALRWAPSHRRRLLHRLPPMAGGSSRLSSSSRPRTLCRPPPPPRSPGPCPSPHDAS